MIHGEIIGIQILKIYLFSMPLLYLPENALAIRMYDWLLKAERIKAGIYYPRETLLDLVIKAGYSKDAGFTATKNLEEVANVASYWDTEERTVYYLVEDINSEAKLKRIQVEMEFNMMP